MKPGSIVTRYYCGDCWGPLRVVPDGGEGFVECVRHGPAHRGLAFADWVRSERRYSELRFAMVYADYIDTDYAIGLGLRKKRTRRSPAEAEAVLANGRRALGRDGSGIN